MALSTPLFGKEVKAMSPHYACSGGCGGMSDHPKVCETDSCPMKGEMMSECHCTDGSHSEVVSKKEGDS